MSLASHAYNRLCELYGHVLRRTRERNARLFAPDRATAGLPTFEQLEPRLMLSADPVNHLAVAVDDAYAVDEDNTLTVAVLDGVLAGDSDADGDELTAVLVDNVAHGTLDLNPDGSFTYTSAQDYNGSDSFTYVANDGTADSNVATVMISVEPVGAIYGQKWHDLNSDGMWDAGELPLEGWTIYLDLDEDGEFDEGIEPSTVTNAAGEYAFVGLDPGTYIVAEVMQEGWEQTYPGGGGGGDDDPTVADIVSQVDIVSYTSIHQDLLYTYLGDNRGAMGGADHDPARDNILTYFEGLGLDASLDPFVHGGYTGENVVGIHLSSVNPNDIYIVGAHYDSANNPGADDNGSGTAGIMEAARVLSQYEFDSTLIFIAFDQEEQGLHGSYAYVEEHIDDNILGMLNLDMIAYNPAGPNEDMVHLYDVVVGGSIKSDLIDAFNLYGGDVVAVDSGQNSRSDHAPFEVQGFDAALAIEYEVWSNPNYHTASDAVETPSYIDYGFATNITAASVGYLATAAGVLPLAASVDDQAHSGADQESFLAFYWPPQSHLFELGGFLSGPSTDAPLDIAVDYLTSHAAELGLAAGDLDNFVVTDQHVSEHNGVTHIYLGQTYGGLEVLGANINVNITADGQVINVGSSFVSGLGQWQLKFDLQPTLSASGALVSLATDFGWTLDGAPVAINSADDLGQTTLLTASGVSLELIPSELFYVPTSDGGVELAWNLVVETLDGEHVYDAGVSTSDGDVLYWSDWVTADTYNVYEQPIEGPSDGPRTLVVNPADATASPYGWHDTDGVAGAEYTVTRGNNVHAYADRNGDNVADPGSDPDGGAGLIFDFPIDLGQEPVNYQDAAVANLFYWNNVIHDVYYQYGFDEQSGNFQVNNYGEGGLGGDDVRAEAQDGADVGYRNNANFYTPPDGSRPRMQMYVWNLSTPMRDSDLDNGIIIHEYTHGLSNRLTGGPGNAGALSANQSGSMGEGWSDWYALMLTQVAADAANDGRGIGTYALGQPTTGRGIRTYRYSYDMAVNPHTYGDISGLAVPHGAGEVWAATIWDLNWALINGNSLDPNLANPGLGFDPDLYNGTGGNNLAMQLVMDGMKLQPALPTYLDARDAILLADQVLTGGANQMTIWTVFARRGMGFSADDGGNPNNMNVTEAFDLPARSQGTVAFDQIAYEIGELVTITVCDSDLAGGGPIAVGVVSNGGDNETVTLAEIGAGVFEGSILTASGSAAAANGTLEVGVGNVITVTYNDADDGTGNPAVLTDIADIITFTEIYSADMNTDPGWTLDPAAAPYQWEWGTPTGGGGQYGNADPSSGYTGSNVVGYNLSGDYPNRLSPTQWATTPAIDCSNYTNVQLEFYRWLNVERPAWDHAYIEVSNDGSNWNRIWQNTSQITDSSWTLQTLDISSTADQQATVYIRWGMGTTDGSWQYSGWNIDDVVVKAASDGLPGTHTVVLGPGEIVTGINFGNRRMGLSVSLPADAWESDGTLAGAGTVSISRALASDLVVSLSSDDTTELDVPATVTILAGTTSATFDLMIQDDGEYDGVQTVMVTAVAAEVRDGSDTMAVRDDDVHHLAFDAIADPQFGSEPFAVTIYAEDVDNETILVYAGTVDLSGAGDGGPVPVDPTTGAFVNGQWTGSVAVHALDTNVVLTADDGAGLVGTSNAFDVVHGPVDHFGWSEVWSPQYVDMPFDVTLTALDAHGYTVSDFNSSVDLSAWVETGGTVTLFEDDFEDGNYDGWVDGSAVYPRMVTDETSAGGDYSFTMIGSGTHYNGVHRTFADMNPDHIEFYVRSGNASRHDGYFVAGEGGLNAAIWFYMRYDGYMALVSSTTYVVPYQINQWYHVSFDIDWTARTVDFYVDGALIQPGAPFRGSTVDEIRRVDLYNYTSSQAWWDEIQFSAEGGRRPIAMSPIVATLVNGVWTGDVAVLEEATDVYLEADDGSGHIGDSNLFDVVPGGPPVAADNASVTVDEGQTAANTGTFYDPGDNTVTLTASVGTITDNGNGTWSWSFAATDGPDDSQTVTITATNSDNAATSTTFDLTVNNVAPTVDVNYGWVMVDEGESAANTGTFYDPGNDMVTLAASVGAITDNGNGTWSWSFATTDGPDDSQTVTITATDSDNDATFTTFALVVNNVAPTIALSGAAGVDEGSPYTLTLGAVTDPGDDTIVGVGGYIVHWGDGRSDTYDAPGNVTHTYADGPATPTIIVDLVDKDGTHTAAGSLGLTVNNVAPVVDVNYDLVTVDEGESAINWGTYGDPGMDDIILSVSLGDITDNGDGTYGWYFLAMDGAGNSETVTITATDSDGAATSTTFDLVVNNVAPVVDAGLDQAVDEGDPMGVLATFDDVGTLDTHTAQINWGDGAIEDGLVDQTDGTVWGSHVYADGGLYTVTVTVTDDDGGVASDTLAMTVNDVFSTMSGLVWVDFNNDGLANFGEGGIAGETVGLTGTDDREDPVSRTVTTDANGVYTFDDVRPGNYTITEVQPTGFVDGKDALGTVNTVYTGNATVNDEFSGIVLTGPDSVVVDYNFGERPEATGDVTAGDTATIGFWRNKHGQELIENLNGDENSTLLGDWLAATLPNMLGADAGENDLTGMTNDEVADFYERLFSEKMKAKKARGVAGPAKVDAQVMATALATYVTNQTLVEVRFDAPDPDPSLVAIVESYGFTVSEYGVGAAAFDVGDNGDAFGVDDNTVMTVMDLLVATNARTVDGLLYDLNDNGSIERSEQDLRAAANAVYGGINEQGDISAPVIEGEPLAGPLGGDGPDIDGGLPPVLPPVL